jgi:hypothetical protein
MHELRAYLERIARSPEGIQHYEIAAGEINGHWQHLLESLDRIGGRRKEPRVAELYDRWWTEERLRRFVETLTPV